MSKNISIDGVPGFVAVGFKYCYQNIIFIEVCSIKDGTDNRFQVEDWRVTLNA